MCDMKKHPSMEEIMAFVTPSGKIGSENREKTFEMIAHFVACEECRAVKDAMIRFTDRLEKKLNSAADNMLSRMIMYSAEKLNMKEQVNEENIKIAFRGIVAKNTLDSKIILDKHEKYQEGFEYVNELQTENEIADQYNNRIFLGEECIKVTLADDGKDEHGVLMIPGTAAKAPVYVPMEKKEQTWEVACSCREDEYDIVIF